MKLYRILYKPLGLYYHPKYNLGNKGKLWEVQPSCNIKKMYITFPSRYPFEEKHKLTQKHKILVEYFKIQQTEHTHYRWVNGKRVEDGEAYLSYDDQYVSVNPLDFEIQVLDLATADWKTLNL